MSKETIIQAKTFTCNYNEREDRILLTINYEDITQRVDFWITRSFLVKLLPYFFEYTTGSFGSEIVTQEKSQQNVTSTDLSTFELTSKEPILLDSIDFTKLETGMKIVFKNLEKKVYAVGLFDEALLENVVTLILKAAPSYEWGINN